MRFTSSPDAGDCSRPMLNSESMCVNKVFRKKGIVVINLSNDRFGSRANLVVGKGGKVGLLARQAPISDCLHDRHSQRYVRSPNEIGLVRSLINY